VKGFAGRTQSRVLRNHEIPRVFIQPSLSLSHEKSGFFDSSFLSPATPQPPRSLKIPSPSANKLAQPETDLGSTGHPPKPFGKWSFQKEPQFFAPFLAFQCFSEGIQFEE
jgi:hypothetical protein